MDEIDHFIDKKHFRMTSEVPLSRSVSHHFTPLSMNLKSVLFLSLGTFFATPIFSQQLHSDANAASVSNEANSTAGWINNADIFSDNSDSVFGDFSLRIESTNNGRFVSFSFDAVVGADYTIRIWARQGPQVTSPPAPAFASWSGFQGFRTTPISSDVWTEYVFNLSARNTNPQIRIYTGTSSSNGISGNTVFIDGVSITRDGGDTEPPAAISDLAASNTTLNTTTLSWSAVTDNVSVANYEIFRDGESIGNTGLNTSFTDSGLTPATSYSYYVVAQDEAGNSSGPGNTISVTTISDEEAPSAITDLSASNTTATTTLLSWSPATDNVGISNYQILQGNVIIGNVQATTSFTVTGLAPETSYSFTVVAQDVSGNLSSESNTVVITTATAPATDTEAPSAVSDLSANNTSANTTQLSWSASTDNTGVINYEIFQDNSSIGNSGTATTFNVSGLAAQTSYVFYVRARDEAGNISNIGNSITVTTAAAQDTSPPTNVANLNASNTTSNSTFLSWNASSDNVGVVNYAVYRNGTLISNSGTNTSFSVSGLSPNTSYTFTVRAADAAGNVSGNSNAVSVTTLSDIGGTNYTSQNANLDTVDWLARDLFATRNLGVGTQNTRGFTMAVAGGILAEELTIELQANWPDYVFNKGYTLPTLEVVERHIQERGHLINVPSASEIKASGLKVGEMQSVLMEKIEELMLYTIEQEKRIKALEAEILKLHEEADDLEVNQDKGVHN
jgi:chitodextrinase